MIYNSIEDNQLLLMFFIQIYRSSPEEILSLFLSLFFLICID